MMEGKTKRSRFGNYFALISAVILLNYGAVPAQQNISRTSILPGEKWYGAAVNEGYEMPFKEGYSLDLNNDVRGNQAAPLLLSNKGRYIWCNEPFAFSITGNEIIVKNGKGIVVNKPGNTLADAFGGASKEFFPASGKMPHELLFTSPQYNTWIELIYNQNQQDILKYAHDIIRNGFAPGVLMIDDNWAPYYGRFEFRKDRFSDAKDMIDELHRLGFKVMLWVCPFIRPDSEDARFLMKNRWVLMDNEGNQDLLWSQSVKPAIVQWWNGFSMVMDFTNADAMKWYQEQLDNMAKYYGIDGFKFDAGDPDYYPARALSFKKISANQQTELWGSFGLKYPLNEYRAMWKRGGEPLAERLRDKSHTWEDLKKLIPGVTTAGLLGYPFVCPDMIGGGDYSSFLDVDAKQLDQDLVVRSAQCHALMPMMQFSVAPWRILDKDHLDAVKKAVDLRKKYTPMIMQLVKQSALSGVPVVRHMEYAFPNDGFESCIDQFMLGSDIMVAPVLSKNNTRTVLLPRGMWMDQNNKMLKGPIKLNITASLDELPYYRRIKK